jgi:hypothetical protein
MADRISDISAHMWNRMSDRMPDGIFEYIYICQIDCQLITRRKYYVLVCETTKNHSFS